MVDADLLAERHPVFRAHIEASFGFQVAEPYHGPVVHLIASESLSQHPALGPGGNRPDRAHRSW
ncbi:hypothetical protein F0L68_21875 [Solihabitans fulvus]|uniref:Uncharacterized protein n=1 Tax=Solihabitans fulvus TaxID=1892852 RepID=A0A5B2X7G6_9PSEU|nr:hypothetical protein [Solihabitans fulvus]KAA2259160.1 hypothetical protein F0L68_21875 [Solihabitans fulvus]